MGSLDISTFDSFRLNQKSKNSTSDVMDTSTIFSNQSEDVSSNLTSFVIQTSTTAINVTVTTPWDDCVICDYEISAATKAIRILLGLSIMLANAVMAVAVVRAKALQAALRAFLVNLAVSDALMGLSFSYLSVVVDIWTHFTLECRVRYGSLSYLHLVTLYTILVFSLKKVITLARPLHSTGLEGRKTLIVTLTLLWTLPVIMTVIGYEMRNEQVTECYFGRFTGTAGFFLFAVSNIIAFAVIVICQIIIFVMAKIQVNKIAPTMVGDNAAFSMTRMNVRVAVTTLAVVTPFLLLSTPLLVGYLYLAVHPESRTSKEYFNVITVQFILTIFNCVVDPVVFCIRLRSVRLELRRIGRTVVRGKCDDISGNDTSTSIM